MSDFNLQVNYREKKGKSYRKELARREMVPGVVYGKGAGSIPVELEYRSLRTILQRGGKPVIDLTVQGPGAGETRNYKVLIKEMQYDPIKGDLMNIDFHQISLDDDIQTAVPINYVTGKVNGIVQYLLRELQVSCLPGDIPQEVTVNVDGLAVGDTITVQDIAVPDKVTVLDEPDTAVVTVVAQQAEDKPAAEEEAEGAAEAEAQEE
ncbi:50S ribosomal protein L25 [Desulfoscipio geothermicus]|uniref:Large ribosomal subunit protein bL25 n=1 Tax=Desulfoscipio geothermicus DSM 3669 TaxID=1121426 RepID=A0A1I6DGA4_9FIRM|nr:50S ribosomal protein L25 [Desulfoscipio geothermicus]SFR04411.1 LSU ribosomal protein L25P [Desulfoscipio geothermicus DSM 3669]